MKKLTLNFFDIFFSCNSIYWIWCDKRQNSRVCLPWRHFWIAHASFWHGSLLLLDIPPTNLPLYSIMLLINPTASLQAPQSCHDEIKLVYIEDLGSTVHSASFWTLMIVASSSDIGLIFFCNSSLWGLSCLVVIYLQQGAQKRDLL